MMSLLDAFSYTGSMEDTSCPRLLIGTQLLSVQVALILGMYLIPAFFTKFYGIHTYIHKKDLYEC